MNSREAREDDFLAVDPTFCQQLIGLSSARSLTDTKSTSSAFNTHVSSSDVNKDLTPGAPARGGQGGQAAVLENWKF